MKTRPRCVGTSRHLRLAVAGLVTHDEKFIPTFKRIYHIRDGRTEERAGEGREVAA